MATSLRLRALVEGFNRIPARRSSSRAKSKIEASAGCSSTRSHVPVGSRITPGVGAASAMSAMALGGMR